ncbi:MAG: outer membrane protein assembly factor BamD [Desulfuromonas sp.]|nr:MAG: outer membrane protein assembly factor BamD [Desulfuromonas sp.]
MIRVLPYLFLLSFILPACTPKIVPPPPSADHYLQEGEGFYADKRYEDAIATWEKVRDTFASPEKTAHAQFRIGETQFTAEMYPEAAATLEEFIKQHPEHPRTDEALYLLGLAYYQQRLASDQDQTAIRNAKVTLETLLRRTPDSPHKDEVEEILRYGEQVLLESELNVGRFYLRTDHPGAALLRLEPLTSADHFTRRDEVYYLLGKAYFAANRRDDAVEAFNTLYRLYPKSKYVLKAQKFVEKSF